MCILLMCLLDEIKFFFFFVYFLFHLLQFIIAACDTVTAEGPY